MVGEPLSAAEHRDAARSDAAIPSSARIGIASGRLQVAARIIPSEVIVVATGFSINRSASRLRRSLSARCGTPMSTSRRVRLHCGEVARNRRKPVKTRMCECRRSILPRPPLGELPHSSGNPTSRKRRAALKNSRPRTIHEAFGILCTLRACAAAWLEPAPGRSPTP
jgi:hypothetical protein